MKKTVLTALLAVLAFGAIGIRAQDKTKSEGAALQVTPLRIQVVFAEYDGDKKISSLPYTVLVNANDKGPQAAVRMGLRVPVETGASTEGVNRQYQYQDIGTNLDGRADSTEDGRFNLKLNVEKSSLYTPAPTDKPGTIAGNPMIIPGHFIIQSFRSQVNLLLRDGQTMQATVASDPVTGHVLKLEVTLNVIK